MVIEYFSRRKESLLVVDITKSLDIIQIVDFLGLPSWINFSMPHMNKTVADINPNSIQLLSPEIQDLFAK